MSDREELEKKAKATYHFRFGCLGLIPQKGLPSKKQSLAENIHKLFISDKLVKSVEKPIFESIPEKLLIGQQIGSQPLLESQLEIEVLDMPAEVHMSYDLSSIDSEVTSAHRIPNYDMEAILLYDGFIYLFGIKEPEESFNFRRHAARLETWLENLLTQKNDWKTLTIHRSPFMGSINLFLISEGELEVPFTEDEPFIGEEIAVIISDINYEYTRGKTLGATYYLSEGESIREALSSSTRLLYSGLKPLCTSFYSAQKISYILDSANLKATELLGNATDEYLKFYKISFLNLYKRFRKCTQIGSLLSSIYSLMPTIEINEREYKAKLNELDNAKEEQGKVESELAKF